jgi:hypothetical protein
MKIKYVTLTGADDNTRQEELLNLSEQYPFVEWGILFSQKKAGVAPRYPDWGWVISLAHLVGTRSSKANFSAHLCGKWVDDAMEGLPPFGEEFFDRIQLNMAQGRLSKALQSESKVWESVTKVAQDVIFGGPYQKYNLQVDTELFTNKNVYPLFDTSGGRGQLAKEWPKPVDMLCGYAGGLNPDNLEDELRKIEAVVGDSTIWIDMESGVRTDNEFDLDKCERVLEIAEKYVA